MTCLGLPRIFKRGEELFNLNHPRSFYFLCRHPLGNLGMIKSGCLDSLRPYSQAPGAVAIKLHPFLLGIIYSSAWDSHGYRLVRDAYPSLS